MVTPPPPQQPPAPPPKKPAATTTIPPCDFCSDRAAVLYCRADSARLCLLCDQHVHTANLLSKKHVRSQICDNCGCEPVTVRCATDNLSLCTDCDCDAHSHSSSSSSHLRSSVDGFSGCPSALELASLWGVSLDDNAGKFERFENPNWVSDEGCYRSCDADEFMVPSDVALYGNLLSGCGNNDALGESEGFAMSGLSRDLSTSNGCGKYKNAIRKQLVELFKRDLIGSCGGGGGGGGGEGLVAEEGGIGNANGGLCVGDGDGDGGGGGGQELLLQHQQQQGTFTSLLMFQQQQGMFEPRMDLKPGGRDLIWDGNGPNGKSTANASSTQVMD